MTDIIDAHRFSIRHKSELINDGTCGCFYCMRTFSPKEIKDWVNDGEDYTAICPYCGIDSIIGQSSGYPITRDFLKRMNKHWF